MGVYDTLVLPGTKADGEQVKCWGNRLHSIRVGDRVPPIYTVMLRDLPLEENAEEETEHRDYVIVMRCNGCLVVRDSKLQGYYDVGEIVPGDPPLQELPMFDKWGEPWVDTWHNNGILGEPYFYHDAAVVRTINALARARPTRDPDHDTRDA